jgi:hypothetical protein
MSAMTAVLKLLGVEEVPADQPEPAINADQIDLDVYTALVDLEREISARFTKDYARAPQFMDSALRGAVVAAREAMANVMAQARKAAQ